MNAAMPTVEDNSAYRDKRKQEIYAEVGRITAKERRTLIRLQEQLGLDASIAQTIEVGVLDTRGGT